MTDEKAIFKDIESKVGKRSFSLLYDSTDKVSVAEFHEKCDAKGPTVTILYGKYNVIFGGYTFQSWCSPDRNETKRDEHAFLFYKNDIVEAECVFMPVKQKYADKAITCNKRLGPTFGHKNIRRVYDLQTFKEEASEAESDIHVNDGFIHLNGKMNIGNSYDVNAKLMLEEATRSDRCESESGRSAISYTVKREDINSGTLTLKRIAVYQVVDEQRFEPWRMKPEEKETEEMKKRLERLKPISGLGIKHYNILLVGALGAGKSSFINTLSTVLAGSIKTHAAARGCMTSVTNELNAYALKSKDGNPLNLRIFDISGYVDKTDYVQELTLLLEGKLPIGYKFSDKLPADDEMVGSTGLKEQIHLVCFVTGTPNLELETNNNKIIIQEIQKTINKKGLPMVVVATKLDEFCPEIHEDADHVYNSHKARDAIKSISSYLGIKRVMFSPL